MKKVFVLFGAIILSTGMSLAVIDESKTSDIDSLRDQGFSESMLEIVDTVRYRNSNAKVPRYFDKSRNKMGRGYSSLKQYIDPCQDDGLFGEHQVHFSNSWDWGKNRYAVRKKKVIKTENL